LAAGGNAKSIKGGFEPVYPAGMQGCSMAAEMDFMDKVKIKFIPSIRFIYCHSG
jgi:hypothetical protein